MSRLQQLESMGATQEGGRIMIGSMIFSSNYLQSMSEKEWEIMLDEITKEAHPFIREPQTQEVVEARLFKLAEYGFYPKVINAIKHVVRADMHIPADIIENSGDDHWASVIESIEDRFDIDEIEAEERNYANVWIIALLIMLGIVITKMFYR